MRWRHRRSGAPAAALAADAGRGVKRTARSPAEYLRPEVIAQVQRLDLRGRFMVEGFYAGLHASPYRGFSVEFSEHRRYSPGDDVRAVDWNVLARTDRLFIKQFRAETNLNAYLLFDASASMSFPPPGTAEPGGVARMSKFDYAIVLGAALGYMMIGQRDGVGLAFLDGASPLFIPARSTSNHLMHLLAALASRRPAGPTELGPALHAVAGRVRKRSLMIVFSDLLCEPDGVIEALRRLRFEGHDLIVFCILDAAEAEFPYHGPQRFVDPEGGTFTAADAAALRTEYLAAMAQHLDGLRRGVGSVRGDFVVVRNDQSFDAALVPFLVDRKRRF